MTFENLSESENQQLAQIPALIAVLLGAADGKLDSQEKIWAEKLIASRAYSKPDFLQPYYKAVSVGFWENMGALLTAFPTEVETRNALISNELARINSVLSKLDQKVGAAIYRSFKMLAEEVAKTSGGFLRFGSVSAAEQKWVSLPMIEPIASPDLKIELGADWEQEDADREAEKWA